MVVKREKIYKKKRSIYIDIYKRTSYWLFGIIPIFIKNEIVHVGR